MWIIDLRTRTVVATVTGVGNDLMDLQWWNRGDYRTLNIGDGPEPGFLRSSVAKPSPISRLKWYSEPGTRNRKRASHDRRVVYFFDVR